MRALTVAALLVPVAALADPAPIAKSVSYFEAHLQELRATLSICHDNAQFADTPTCQNAEAAASGLKARRGPDLATMLSDPRYWSANPIARDGLLLQCQLGTAMEPRFCKPASQSALADLKGRK